MGTTFVKLLIHNADMNTMKPYLKGGDILRTDNLPWTGVLPTCEGPDCGFRRMERMARQISQASDQALILLFDYFDDDEFRLRFYLRGKQVARLRHDDSWRKAAPYIDQLFGDELAKDAFRQASHCATMEERLSLLEETLGVSLYDLPEAADRIVLRSRATLDALERRKAALKNRPNQYKLVPMDACDQPKSFRVRMRLCEMIKRTYPDLSIADLIFHGSTLIWIHDSQGDRTVSISRDRLGSVPVILCDMKSEQVTLLETRRSLAQKALWLTREGHPVLMGYRENGQGIGSVCCLSREDRLIWCFAPELKQYQSLELAHQSDDGILTLYTRISPHSDAVIWRISGETGDVLAERRIPLTEDIHWLRYVEALDAFVYYTRAANELVQLDGRLAEIQRWSIGERHIYFGMGSLWAGTTVFSNAIDGRSVDAFDLATGELHRIVLEIPGFISHITVDGALLASAESLKSFTLYAQDGRVISRHKLKGIFHDCINEEGHTYIIDMLGISIHTFLTEDAAAKATFIVERLDWSGG